MLSFFFENVWKTLFNLVWLKKHFWLVKDLGKKKKVCSAVMVRLIVFFLWVWLWNDCLFLPKFSMLIWLYSSWQPSSWLQNVLLIYEVQRHDRQVANYCPLAAVIQDMRSVKRTGMFNVCKKLQDPSSNDLSTQLQVGFGFLLGYLAPVAYTERGNLEIFPFNERKCHGSSSKRRGTMTVC